MMSVESSAVGRREGSIPVDGTGSRPGLVPPTNNSEVVLLGRLRASMWKMPARGIDILRRTMDWEMRGRLSLFQHDVSKSTDVFFCKLFMKTLLIPSKFLVVLAETGIQSTFSLVYIHILRVFVGHSGRESEPLAPIEAGRPAGIDRARRAGDADRAQERARAGVDVHSMINSGIINDLISTWRPRNI